MRGELVTAGTVMGLRRDSGRSGYWRYGGEMEMGQVTHRVV